MLLILGPVILSLQFQIPEADNVGWTRTIIICSECLQLVSSMHFIIPSFKKSFPPVAFFDITIGMEQ